MFVRNFESTLKWYADQIGFKVIGQQSSPDGKFKFAMIGWNGLMIEMIRNPNTVSRKEAETLKAGNAGSEGFKIGLKIDDLEKHFKEKNVKSKYAVKSTDKFNMRLFILEDPEGNLLQFFTRS